MKAESGDVVEIKTKEEIIKGICMPDEKDFYFIKLDSGYNIGIKKRHVKSINVVGKKKSIKLKAKKIERKKGLDKVVILHTGGTIASRVDYETGGVVAQFKPEELVAMFPELNDIVEIKSRLIGNIMSENIRFAHYNILAKEIKKEIDNGAKGVIVTHGTDTMHYSSAALSFVLKGLNVPVVLVGAQRSSDRGSSDAAINLISSCVFIVNGNINGVFVCMHENENDDKCIIINGLRARKMHTSRRDAFRPINSFAIARIDYKEKKVELLSKMKKEKGKLRLKLFKDNVKVGLLKTRPNMYSSEILAYNGFDGLLIEGTGLGQAPITTFDNKSGENEKIFTALKRLSEKTVIAMSSQAIYGRIQMNVYKEGRLLQDIGVLGNYCDMTPETAYIKLAWLLSNYSKKEAKEMYGKNIRGEISERSENIFLV
jgi:glutamyl-tRNA(Gln) amidotransferase subunit D